MDKIIWSSTFSVGNESLDEHHKKIIHLINTLIDHHANSVNQEVIADVVNELAQYSQYHLEYEERLLEMHQYPEFYQHKALHLKYQEEFSELTAGIGGFEHKEITHRLLEFLTGWWANHILQEDMQYKPFLADNS